MLCIRQALCSALKHTAMQLYVRKKCFIILCDDSRGDLQKVCCETNCCIDKVLQKIAFLRCNLCITLRKHYKVPNKSACLMQLFVT